MCRERLSPADPPAAAGGRLPPSLSLPPSLFPSQASAGRRAAFSARGVSWALRPALRRQAGGTVWPPVSSGRGTALAAAPAALLLGRRLLRALPGVVPFPGLRLAKPGRGQVASPCRKSPGRGWEVLLCTVPSSGRLARYFSWPKIPPASAFLKVGPSTLFLEASHSHGPGC